MRWALAAAVGVVLLAGCSTATAPPRAAVPAVPVYSTIDELTGATMARVRQAGTASGDFAFRIVRGGKLVKTSTGRSVYRIDAAGVSSNSVAQEKVGDAAPTRNEVTILPPDTFFRPDRSVWPEPNPEWIRIDPAQGDPLSKASALTIELNSQVGKRFFCLTELGTPTLTGSAADTFDGAPAQRYRLHVELTTEAGRISMADELRGLGITTIEVDMFVDAQDRIVGCTTDAPLPGGNGAVTSDQRFGAFGDPVEITAPPAEKVLRLPVGR